MATIDDVAKLAGVSPATVSRVMNGNYRLNTEKYRRVMEAMEQLRYTPRQKVIAGQSVQPRSEYTALAVVNVNFSTDSMMLAALERAASSCGLRLSQKVFLDDSAFEDVLRLAGEHDGVLLCDIDLDRKRFEALQAANENVVLFRKQYSFANVVSVGIDDTQAGYDAARYLIERGRKRICYLAHATVEGATPKEAVFSLSYLAKRYTGYLGACAEAGLEPLPPEAFGRLGLYGGPEFDRLDELFRDPECRPDGLICQHPVTMFQIRYLAEKHGIDLMKDLDVISFADNMGPDRSIGLILQPIEKMAIAAMRALRAVIEGDIGSDHRMAVFLPPTLVEAMK